MYDTTLRFLTSAYDASVSWSHFHEWNQGWPKPNLKVLKNVFNAFLLMESFSSLKINPPQNSAKTCQLNNVDSVDSRIGKILLKNIRIESINIDIEELRNKYKYERNTNASKITRIKKWFKFELRMKSSNNFSFDESSTIYITMLPSYHSFLYKL